VNGQNHTYTVKWIQGNCIEKSVFKVKSRLRETESQAELAWMQISRAEQIFRVQDAKFVKNEEAVQ